MRAISRQYKTHHLIIFSIISLAILVGSFVFARVSLAADASEGSRRIITVHDDGKDIGFATEATTLREALKDGGIRLDERDRTEPSLDEELVSNSYQVNIYRARPVLIREGASATTFVTAYRTGQQIASDANIELRDEDLAELSPSTDPLADGAAEVLTITRAKEFKFVFYGKSETSYTQEKTVRGMLSEKGVTLGDKDEVSPGMDVDLEPGMTVKLWRDGTQTITQEEDLSFETQQIKDVSRSLGYKEIKVQGKVGKKLVTYEVDIQDGVEVSRKRVAVVVVVPAEPQVEIIGDKVSLSIRYSADKAAIMTAAGVSTKDQSYAAYIINNENALWCPIRWQGTSGCADTYYEKFPGAESSSGLGYGLCQATPGNKMRSAGTDWRTNVVTQMKWCHSYAISRYGSWEAAYRFKVARGWW